MARHRIFPYTGLGTSEKPLLNNTGKINKKLAKDAIEKYFKKWEGCDYQVTDKYVSLGIEPSYQSQPLKIITISKNKKESYIKTGCAFGYYGSGIASKTKKYKEYKNNCKFTKFVDKWHTVLFS